MTTCSNFKAILRANVTNGDMLVTRARCKMWSCRHCAEVNRRVWRWRIVEAADTLGGNWAFITLTAHGRAKTAETSLSNLQAGWERVRGRMRRKWGKFAYVRVYELHRDGRWHFHALVNFHFDDLKQRKQKDGRLVWYSPALKKMAQECSIGWYTHAENMNTVKGASKYITKYMTKSLELLPKGVRRIQTSQGFPKWQPEIEYEWRIGSGVFEYHLDDTYARGGRVIDVGTGSEITYDDFADSWIYPPELDDGPQKG